MQHCSSFIEGQQSEGKELSRGPKAKKRLKTTALNSYEHLQAM